MRQNLDYRADFDQSTMTVTKVLHTRRFAGGVCLNRHSTPAGKKWLAQFYPARGAAALGNSWHATALHLAARNGPMLNQRLVWT